MIRSKRRSQEAVTLRVAAHCGKRTRIKSGRESLQVSAACGVTQVSVIIPTTRRDARGARGHPESRVFLGGEQAVRQGSPQLPRAPAHRAGLRLPRWHRRHKASGRMGAARPQKTVPGTGTRLPGAVQAPVLKHAFLGSAEGVSCSHLRSEPVPAHAD